MIEETLDTPLVSVLITAYNREKVIGAAIESAINQTYNNLEIIISDDNSTDKTLEIANRYAQGDNRIKVFSNEKKLGQFKNRNTAAKHASGYYLKFLDSDDLMYPHCIQVMVWSMIQHKDAGFGLCKNFIPGIVFPHKLDPEKVWQSELYGQRLLVNAPNSSIYTREAYFAVGGMKEDEGIYADTYLLYDLAQNYPVVLLSHGLVWYRIDHDKVQVSRLDTQVNKAKNDLLFLPKRINQVLLKYPNVSKKNALGNFYGIRYRYLIKMILLARANLHLFRLLRWENIGFVFRRSVFLAKIDP